MPTTTADVARLGARARHILASGRLVGRWRPPTTMPGLIELVEADAVRRAAERAREMRVPSGLSRPELTGWLLGVSCIADQLAADAEGQAAMAMRPGG